MLHRLVLHTLVGMQTEVTPLFSLMLLVCAAGVLLLQTGAWLRWRARHDPNLRRKSDEDREVEQSASDELGIKFLTVGGTMAALGILAIVWKVFA